MTFYYNHEGNNYLEPILDEKLKPTGKTVIDIYGKRFSDSNIVTANSLAIAAGYNKPRIVFYPKPSTSFLIVNGDNIEQYFEVKFSEIGAN